MHKSDAGIPDLPIPLYHGTSTLFLNSIGETGLGGRNPIAEWGILEFARTIQPLVAQHIASDRTLAVKAQSFSWIVEQKSTAMNFQHGDTYLSPVKATAVRYAVNKKYGSELLTYTLDFLQELLNRNIPGVRDTLFQRFPHIFSLLDVSVAPLLFRVEGVSSGSLQSEHGGDPTESIRVIHEVLQQDADLAEDLLGQTNFRLCRPLSAGVLRVWLIVVSRYHPLVPEYSLHELLPLSNNGA